MDFVRKFFQEMIALPPLFFKLISRSVSTLFQFPLLLFAIHLPSALSDVAQLALNEEFIEKRMYLGIALACSISVITTYSEILTVAILRRARTQSPVGLRVVISDLRGTWVHIFLASLILCALLITSLYAYIVPFFIVSAMFLFVPAFMATEPSPSPWPAFNRSLSLSKRRFFTCMAVTFFSFVFLYLIQEAEIWGLEELTKRGLNSLGVQIFFLAGAVVVSCAVNALFSVGVTHFFFWMKEEL